MDRYNVSTASEAIAMLEGYQERIFERASALADSHWDFIYRMDDKLNWEQRSKLFLRCRKVGNSMQIEWYETQWIGSKANKTRKPIRNYISRPKAGYAYPEVKLRSLARDWEIDRVLDTERQMAEYRRESAAVIRALTALRTQARREDESDAIAA